MRKEVNFKYRDRFITLGITIAAIRKMRGMSQEQLAERANISRGHLALIESPNNACSMSLELLFSIADGLDVTVTDLLNTSIPYGKTLTPPDTDISGR